MSERGQRGKTAEKEVKEYFEHLNGTHFDFAFSRLPDARSAGGRLGAVLCDFLVWFKGLSIPLEVKETKHDYRLAKDKLSQLAILQKVAGAGAVPYVLVYFTTIDQWRVAPISYFEFGVPSWDMRDLKLYPDAKVALESTLDFPFDQQPIPEE